MMKKKITDLHERAEQYRAEAQAACDDNNHSLEAQAVNAFERGETAMFFNDYAGYVTGLVIIRLNKVRAGEYVFPFRSTDAERLVKLLSLATEADYYGWGFDDSLSDEEILAASESNNLIMHDFLSSAVTSAMAQQATLFHLMLEYARTAAALAKQIGSASLLDWAGIIDIMENRGIACSCRLGEEDAVQVVELAKTASDRLRLDMIIAALPPFKKARSPKKGR